MPHLDDTIRGIPPGERLLDADIASAGLSPVDGSMVLPVLTLDEGVLQRNVDAVFAFARQAGLLLAPHAKTPMMPELALSFEDRGAWGASVATVQQLAVLLRAGAKRIIYASPPGGAFGCRNLARCATLFPDAEIYVFLDSVDSVEALAQALQDAPGSKVHGLIEIGLGRTGARTMAAVLPILEAMLRTHGIVDPAGVATYEGAAATGTDEDGVIFQGLFALLGDAVQAMRDRLGPGTPIVVSAGGSAYVDLVVTALQPILAADAALLPVLRCGAAYFSDDSLYLKAFEAMAARGTAAGLSSGIRPTLSIYADIISRPEPTLAIAAFGMRDAPNDQGLPIVRALYRGGLARDEARNPTVTKLNDHHAFLACRADDDLRVGDVVECGISHPCTALQRWRVVFGIDGSKRVVKVRRTEFG